MVQHVFRCRGDCSVDQQRFRPVVTFSCSAESVPDGSTHRTKECHAMPDKKTIARAAERPPRRQSAEHAGGRIRARGGPPYPQRKARRPIGQAGDRHRPVEGAARGREPAAGAVKHTRGQEVAGCRVAHRAGQCQTAVAKMRAGGHGGAQARRARRRLDGRAQAPSPIRGGEAQRRCPLGGGAQGGTNQRAGGAPRRSRQSGMDPRPFFGLAQARNSPQAWYLNDSCTRAR
jgi:hypothetical protein